MWRRICIFMAPIQRSVQAYIPIHLIHVQFAICV
jgi:hypothetical protein